MLILFAFEVFIKFIKIKKTKKIKINTDLLPGLATGQGSSKLLLLGLLLDFWAPININAIKFMAIKGKEREMRI
jgi:hypothetical protein